MKTIIFLSPTPPPMHGAAFASQMFLDSVPNDEIRVHHINARFVESVEDLQAFSIKKVLLLVKYITQLKLLILTKRPDAVVLTPAFFRNPFLKDSLFILTARFFRVPVIAWCHMNFDRMELFKQSSMVQKYVQFVLGQCTKFVCVSKLARKQFPEYITSVKFAVVHNGLPEKAISTSMEVVKEADQETVTILYLSNMAEAKGWRDVFIAAEKLCEIYKSAVFEFHGSATADYSQSDIEQLFSSSHHSDRITFHGYADQEQKSDALTRADIFCFASHNETFGLVVLEAMQAGLPVVATDVGAVKNMLDTKKLQHISCVIPPSRPEILRKELELYITDAKLREHDAKVNLRCFEERFSLRTFAQKWRELLL